VDDIETTRELQKAGASISPMSRVFGFSDESLFFKTSNLTSPMTLPHNPNPGRAIGLTGYKYQDADVSHYEWRNGPKKGTQVSIQNALQIQSKPDYILLGYKLFPVWSKPYTVEELPTGPNFELQSELGELTIDEYGSYSRG
jgi:hypothetical protein